jgi:hypothetical protein
MEATQADYLADFDFKAPDYAKVYQERARRLKNIRGAKDKAAVVAGLKEFYKTHPVEFINDWGMTFDPRNIEVGLPAVVPFLLFKRQAEFIEWVKGKWLGRKDGLAEKSRDMGVSWLCVGFAVWMWLFYPGAVVGFGSRKEEYVDNPGDPKSLFWKVRQFIALLPAEFKPVGWNEKKHAPFMKIQNPENGASIVGEAGDNIGRGNRTSIYFKDESAFYERPEAIDAALSQTSNCKIDISTPNGPGNPFARKRHGGKMDVFTFNWRDDPRKGPDWYAAQVEKIDDPVIVAQEIDIDYSASIGDAFIPGAAVDAAQAVGPADLEGIGPLQLGVDVARFGDDKSVITARRGRVVMWQRVYSGLDTMAVAQKVKNEVDAFKAGGYEVHQIAVDTIGIGAGVADKLREFYPSIVDNLGVVIVPSIVVDVNSALRVDDGENYNLRAQMWANMKGWLMNAPVSLPNDGDLKTDLTALKYKFQQNLRLIESKADAKRRGIKSPDRADSLALTFAMPVVMHQRVVAPVAVAMNPLDAIAGY